MNARKLKGMMPFSVRPKGNAPPKKVGLFLSFQFLIFLSAQSIVSDSERESFENKQFAKELFLIRFIFSLKMRKNNYICQLIAGNAQGRGVSPCCLRFFE